MTGASAAAAVCQRSSGGRQVVYSQSMTGRQGTCRAGRAGRAGSRSRAGRAGKARPPPSPPTRDALLLDAEEAVLKFLLLDLQAAECRQAAGMAGPCWLRLAQARGHPDTPPSPSLPCPPRSAAPAQPHLHVCPHAAVAGLCSIAVALLPATQQPGGAIQEIVPAAGRQAGGQASGCWFRAGCCWCWSMALYRALQL